MIWLIHISVFLLGSMALSAPLANPFTRQEAINALKTSSPRWKQIGSLSKESDGKAMLAASLSLPHVGIVSRQFIAQFSAERYGLPQVGDHQLVNVGTTMLEVTQSLYDAASLNKQDAARHFKNYAAEQERVLQNDLVFATLARYLAAQHAKRRLDQSKASLERAEQIHRIAAARVKSGAGIRLDALRADGLLAAEQFKKMELQNSYHKAMEDLAVMVGGLPGEAEVPALRWRQFTLSDPPADFLEKRPDILAQRHSVRASESMHRAARRETWPRLVMAGEVGSVGTLAVLGMGNSNLNFNVGFQLTIPLYDGGLADGKIAEESARLIRSENQLQQQTLEAKHQWESLVRQQSTAEQAYVAAKSQLDAVNEEMRLATEKFKSGSASGLDYRNAAVAQATASQTESEAVLALEVIRLQFCQLLTDYSDCLLMGGGDG